MIDTIKKIWEGPFPVKLSLIFLGLVVFVMFIGNPGLVLFTGGVLYSVSQIINWLSKDE